MGLIRLYSSVYILKVQSDAFADARIGTMGSATSVLPAPEAEPFGHLASVVKPNILRVVPDGRN
jgi:hypothetical protein